MTRRNSSKSLLGPGFAGLRFFDRLDCLTLGYNRSFIRLGLLAIITFSGYISCSSGLSIVYKETTYNHNLKVNIKLAETIARITTSQHHIQFLHLQINFWHD